MHNYCGFFVVVSSLFSTPVSRLTAWNDVSSKAKESFEVWLLCMRKEVTTARADVALQGNYQRDKKLRRPS